LGLEFSKKEHGDDTMARRKKPHFIKEPYELPYELTPTGMYRRKGLTKQQKKFAKSVSICHAKTRSPQAFGDCMSRRLKR